MPSMRAGVRDLKQGIALGCAMAWRRLKVLFIKKDLPKQRRQFVGPHRLMISQVQADGIVEQDYNSMLDK